MSKSINQFQTIRTEGALLPPDILQRIASQKVEGMRPADYHLPEDYKLNERIAQSWGILKKHWKGFQEARERLSETETGTALTNERWLLPLFRELDYGRLTTEQSPIIEDRAYPIERFYNKTPIHLIGCNLTLDRRTKGARGAATASPHSMVQEFLNRSDEHLWAFVSNGRQLRILRDNISLSRQAYIEFDLEGMMDGEVYADFGLLWILCHQSRVEADTPANCWIERWSQLARAEGTRILNNLRIGVANAIEALGRGFIAHPRNDQLRSKLQELGTLSKDDFYRQLLRIVYRLLFLFVAEDRNLLHPTEADEKTRDLYKKYYSTTRLREMSHKLRGSKHADLWHSLSLVFSALGKNEGCPALGLMGLGSFVWNPQSTADLAGPHEANSPNESVQIANEDLLLAIRALAYVEQDRVLRSVDYRNLGSEELGSVYESLLELHADMHVEAKQFQLQTAAGNERKTTGSYYTPDSLVQCLLDSALEPTVEDALRGKIGKDAEKAILGLTVCDPACGSGHFLIAAAHRLARHLARARTGETEPSPEDYQHALRDVIGHCVYGVDINPMAVELCKVSLWMEALEPGKPLSFLDHHIRVGNSLIGATPGLIANGIPDDAFKSIDGDDGGACLALKRLNARERQGIGGLFKQEDEAIQASLQQAAATLEDLPDESPEQIRQKAEGFARVEADANYQKKKRVADTWCAAFVIQKGFEPGTINPIGVTQRFINDLAENRPLPTPIAYRIAELVDHYHFFHWHLAYPEVFARGGFDVMLGNPPWDALSPDAKEFFSSYDPQVRFQDRDGQQQIIDSLLLDPTVAKRWEANCRDLYALVHFLKQSGRFQMFAPGNLGKGDFNVYRMFVEAALSLTRREGRAAQLVPEGLYNGANCAAIRKALYQSCRLDCIYGFENASEVWFEGIDSRMKLCLYAAQVGHTTDTFRAAFNIRSLQHLAEVKAGRYLNMPVRLVKEFSPDALAIMELGTQKDIDIAAKMYRWPAFGNESSGPPVPDCVAEIHMGNNRDLFGHDATGIPLCEGRMIAQFDHRAKAYSSGRGRAADWEDLPFGDKHKAMRPQWYISKRDIPDKLLNRVSRFRACFCKVVSPTNERTLIATLVPPYALCGDSVPTLLFSPVGFEWFHAFWIAVANTYAMDFVARTKVALNLTMTILYSLPFPRPASDDARIPPIIGRSLRLLCTGPEMIPYWNQLAAEGWVAPTTDPTQIPGELDADVRLRLHAEIDAIVARDLCQLTRSELEYILSTFPTQKRYQEEIYGEFRSRRLVLEAFDSMEPCVALPTVGVKTK